MGCIYLVRHGQASFGAGDYDKLSRVGHQQASVLGEALARRGVRTDAVVCGGMKRHRETASECLRALGVAESWREDRGFDEYDHQAMLEALDPRYRRKSELLGAMLREGSLRHGFQKLFAEAAARWASGRFDDDYDESFDEFRARVLGSLAVLRNELGRGRDGFVFSSGGAISVVVGDLLGLSGERVMELSYTLVNAAVTKLIVGARGLSLGSFNDHSHFEVRDARLITYR